MRIANPFRVENMDELKPVTCVYKLHFGKKYLILKCLKLNQSVSNFAKQIDRELRSPKEDSILYNAVAYIKRYAVPTMRVEILHETDDPVSLLMFESDALKSAKNDKECLNTSFSNLDYFPSWIPQAAIVEYKDKIAGVSKKAGLSKDVYFKRFLSKLALKKCVSDKIFDYVKERYR